MTKRKTLSVMKRLRIFEAALGGCHICGRRIQPGEPWDVSHDRPLALLGEDGGDNLKVAHRACHREQTTIDQARITKARRQAAKHIGAKQRTGFYRPKGMRFDWRAGRYIKEHETSR